MTNAIRVLEPGEYSNRGCINHIHLLESDGSERQIIKDMDGNMPRPKIRACSISDPYALIIREDDTIGLFIETERGKIRRKDMSPMGDKVSTFPLDRRRHHTYRFHEVISLFGWLLLQRRHWDI